MQKVCRAQLLKFFVAGMTKAGYGVWSAADWDALSEGLKRLWVEGYKESLASKKLKET